MGIGDIPSNERFWVSQGYLYESYEAHTPTVREATRSERHLASEIERLTRELEIRTIQFDAECRHSQAMREQLKAARAALEKIGRCRMMGISSVGPLHGAGMEQAFEVTAKIAREALAVTADGPAVQPGETAGVASTANAVRAPRRHPEPCGFDFKISPPENLCLSCGWPVKDHRAAEEAISHIDPDLAFESGWCAAAEWAHRDDLLADIGSAAYHADMTARLRKIRAEETGERTNGA